MQKQDTKADIFGKLQHRLVENDNGQMMKRVKRSNEKYKTLRKGSLAAVLLSVFLLIGCAGEGEPEENKIAMEVAKVWTEESKADVTQADKEDWLQRLEGRMTKEAMEAGEETEQKKEPVHGDGMQPIEAEAVINNEEGLLPEEVQAETESYSFTESDREYFSDALFIGDSRTVGLREYGTLDNADYFATPGLSLYSIPKTKVTIGEYENISLEELLDKKDYGKIYVMLGINELGYDFETTLVKYQELVEELQTKEPDAILYLCANLHVTSIRDENDELHNNASINHINSEIAAMSDDQNVFYLDVNPLFDDEKGNLSEEYASDDSHILGKYYEQWCEWLEKYTIVK